jgi:hypothetical protein
LPSDGKSSHGFWPGELKIYNLTNVCPQNKQLPQISYLENKKTTTYGHGYPGPSLQQAQKCGWVKQFNVTPYLIIGSPMAFIQIKINWGPVAQGYPILL